MSPEILNTLLIISTVVLLSACGFGKAAKSAEPVAEKFYEMQASDNLSQLESILDEGALAANSIEEWKSVIQQKKDCGAFVSSEKKMGFHTSIDNGITSVTLNYKTSYESCVYHEKIVLVERNGTYKVYSYEYNTDASKLSSN